MKITPIALALCLSVVPVANAIADTATQQTTTLEFQAVIPEKKFTIKAKTPLPQEGTVTTFDYHPISGRFSPYENSFLITSKEKVTARLEKSADLVLNKTTKIGVVVTLGNKPIALTAVDVHPADAGTPPVEKEYTFSVLPATGFHAAGTYKGSVVLIFDVG